MFLCLSIMCCFIGFSQAYLFFFYLVCVWSGLCGLILKPFSDKSGCTAHLPLISIMCLEAHKITKAPVLSASPFCIADVELAWHFKPDIVKLCDLCHTVWWVTVDMTSVYPLSLSLSQGRRLIIRFGSRWCWSWVMSTQICSFLWNSWKDSTALWKFIRTYSKYMHT